MRNHSTRMTLLYSIVYLLAVPTLGNATEDTVKLVKNIKPAVVLIQTFDANNSPLATGSGFFIDNKGSLITNHHVIEGAYSATVKTSQGKEYQITAILAKDTEADIVKLSCGLISSTQNPKLKTQNSFGSPSSDPNFPFLKLSKQIPSEGEDIVVVGNPLGLESSVSTGIVSAVRDIPAFGSIIQISKTWQ
ncbi:MAG: trypsin-like peptidase domain-containing protein [Sedimentisphaerales bacterium]|nr:trypsin-like peptidase domain-containing protein [Sedimentisphaerales bacterium]